MTFRGKKTERWADFHMTSCIHSLPISCSPNDLTVRMFEPRKSHRKWRSVKARHQTNADSFCILRIERVTTAAPACQPDGVLLCAAAPSRSLSERPPYIIHGSYVEEALPNRMCLIQGGIKTFRGDLIGEKTDRNNGGKINY